ncbi:Carboxylesterase 1E, partial [Lemmus lemmus]
VSSLCPAGHPSSPPVVNTRQGKVLGKYVSLEGFTQPVAVFLGVPFAKPPLGSLRFAPPQPAEPWSFVKNATSYPPMCSQDAVSGQLLNDLLTNHKEKIDLKFSEDCLYLNIYTPANLMKKNKDRLPVMVWIYGGGLILGGASTYDGLALSAYENVVVVIIQYRVGIWGFFSTGDEHSRGNWGHWDQVAALRWIQDNIASFGGDPGSVTIFGLSSGSESVSVLVSVLANPCLVLGNLLWNLLESSHLQGPEHLSFQCRISGLYSLQSTRWGGAKEKTKSLSSRKFTVQLCFPEP